MIQFKTTSDECAERIAYAMSVAFEGLEKPGPGGVGLAYWRVPGGRCWLGLIESTYENANAPMAQTPPEPCPASSRCMSKMDPATRNGGAG